jgi:hypothetical protein
MAGLYHYLPVCNVIHKRVAHTSESPTKTPKRVNLTKVNMPQPTEAQSSKQEGRILLAINAIKQGQFQSVRAAAALSENGWTSNSIGYEWI